MMFTPFFIKNLFPKPLGILGGIGDFLFGSDPGKKSRGALQDFGLGRGSLSKELNEGLTAQALLSGARSRQSSGQSLSRSGLMGSGIARDIQDNADLLEADFLRKSRMDLIGARLRALGVVAGTPKQGGLVQSALGSLSLGVNLGGGGKE